MVNGIKTVKWAMRLTMTTLPNTGPKRYGEYSERKTKEGCCVNKKLTWDEFRSMHHEDYNGHYYQKQADLTGEPVVLYHPSHNMIYKQYEPEV